MEDSELSMDERSDAGLGGSDGGFESGMVE